MTCDDLMKIVLREADVNLDALGSAGDLMKTFDYMEAL